AEFCGGERRFGELRKSLGQKFARRFQVVPIQRPILMRCVDANTPSVVGNLEAVTVDCRDSVDDPLAEIDPDRKLRRRIAFRSLWNFEVMDFLLRRTDPGA